jgi:hypothetical protein
MHVAMFLFLAALGQQPAETQVLEIPVLDADQRGDCSADFTVIDADGQPIYGAMIHVKVRYGFLGVKRADLEVGTNSDGKARIEGLSDGARPLVFHISKAERETTEEQDVKRACRAAFETTLR